MRSYGIYCVLFLLISFFTVPVSAQLSRLSEAEDARIDYLYSSVIQNDEPGCAVGLINEGERVFLKGYGQAVLEYDIPITPNTVFHAASVSKPFTALAILMLAEQDKIDLDEPITNYFSYLSHYDEKITIRHLLTHTSGLRDQWSLLQLAGWRRDDVITQQDVLDMLSRQSEMNFEPGTNWLYSNTGYTILAELVEQVSGQRFKKYTREQIFRPLDMHDTQFIYDHDKVIKNRASAYDRSYRDSSWEISMPHYNVVGPTNLQTTVDDLLKFAANAWSQNVAEDALKRLINSKIHLSDGSEIDHYGLGVSKESIMGLNAIGHTGKDAGFAADLLIFPEEESAAVTLCNTSDIYASSLNTRAATIILSEKMHKFRTYDHPSNPVYQIAERLKKTNSSNSSTTVPSVSAFKGYYFNRSKNRWWQFSIKDSTLYRSQMGRQYALRRLDEKSFLLDRKREPKLYRFQMRNDSDSIITVLEIGRRDSTVYHRHTSDPLKKKDISEFTGAYHSPELEVTWLIKYRNDSLLLDRRKFQLQPLLHRFDNHFRWGNSRITFTEKHDRVTGLEVSTARVKHLKFLKIGVSY